MVRVGVLGQGAIGRAVGSRLRAEGFTVLGADRSSRRTVLDAELSVLVLALTRGKECLAQLTEADRLPPHVLDLTTQTPQSARQCAERVLALGSLYCGGGLTGGGHQIASGTAVLVLGPAVAPCSPVRDVIAALGRAITFAAPEHAAKAKLLHNWVLIVQQWAAALAVQEAGSDLDALVEVLSSGTVGRRVPDWSVVRDAAGRAESTYLGRLVAKDLGEIKAALPRLAAARDL